VADHDDMALVMMWQELDDKATMWQGKDIMKRSKSHGMKIWLRRKRFHEILVELF